MNNRDALSLASAVENACQTLPGGWQVHIALEQGAGVVTLFDPNGYDVDFPSNHETLAESIHDAHIFARQQESSA